MLDTVLGSIADSLRVARVRHGYTLDRLAELSGLSKAHLSRLESADRQPSLAALLTLSRVLGVPMSALLGEDGDASTLATYGDEHPVHAVNGLTVTTYSGFPGSRALEAVRIAISTGRPPPPFARHAGEEWIYVLSGELRLEYDGAIHVIATGHAAHFDADRPHRLGARTAGTEVLLVAAEGPAPTLTIEGH